MEEQWEKNYPARILLIALVIALVYIFQAYILYLPIETTLIVTSITAVTLIIAVFLRDLSARRRERGSLRDAQIDPRKGRKLIEISEKPLGNNKTTAVAIAIILVIAVIAIAYISYSKDKDLPSTIISTAIMFTSAIFSLFTSSKLIIYENGIEVNRRFIRWEEIKGYRREGKYLVIEVSRFPKRIKLRDKNRKMEDALSQLLSQRVQRNNKPQHFQDNLYLTSLVLSCWWVL
ncbi:MAG: DUF986 family protein [Thermoplasmata archaeon]|nr:MAG: DUF986 family protein [Thermoplasmata archaeon]